MSNEVNETVLASEVEKSTQPISLIIKPQKKDLGEFSVRRALPSKELAKVGPWVFFDHAGPAHFTPGSGINVRPHPHINLATVTYLFAGEILHRDSVGSYAVIKPGDINLMVAGKGITHSERERDEVKNVEHTLDALQLWLALPEEDEEVDPAFYHYPSDSLPQTKVNGVFVKVLMGSAYGLTSPVLTFAETLYLEAHMKIGQNLELPENAERAIYLVEGGLEINGAQIEQQTMVVLKPSEKVVIAATAASKIVIIGGEKITKRYVEWNFVSSRKERIEQAKQDWSDKQFAKVKGDEYEFIPLP